MTFLGLPWVVWGGVCLAIAAIYTAVWPRAQAAAAASRWQAIVLRWFHALVWVLLALSCLLRIGQPSGQSLLANIAAVLALVVYLVFMGTLLLSRRGSGSAGG